MRELIFSIFVVALGLILYYSEMTGKTKMSSFIFSFSNCKNENMRKLFVTTFFVCMAYAFWHIYLSTQGFNDTNQYKWDIMGNGQKSIIGSFGTWQISHFILYFIYGFNCPNDFWFAFTLGTGYEIFELMMGIVWQGMNFSRYWTTGAKLINYNDIFANTLGYIAGSTLKKIINKNI